jgi:response regulator of citrate/malate metabolism
MLSISDIVEKVRKLRIKKNPEIKNSKKKQPRKRVEIKSEEHRDEIIEYAINNSLRMAEERYGVSQGYCHKMVSKKYGKTYSVVAKERGNDKRDYIRKRTKIKELEDKHGDTIDNIVNSYSKNGYSFSRAMKELGIDYRTFCEYKDRFKPRAMIVDEKRSQEIREHNKNRAKKYFGMTVKEISEKTGVSHTTIRRRLKLGLSKEEVMKK